MKIKNTQSENLFINLSKNNNSQENSNISSSKNKKSSNIIYAGELNADSDKIGLKKQQAQKKAMKSIMDQYKNEKKSDDNVTELREKQAELLLDAETYAKYYKNLENVNQDLKAMYGITDDSPEQKNLDLLEKSIYGSEPLTEDEQKQLEEMGSLTDYQKNALFNDAMKKEWGQQIEAVKNGIMGINQTITSISLAKLKSHPMVDAQKEAVGILEAASKEVIGTLMQQTKETEDEKLKENEEEVKKQQEAKKEEEAKKEKAAEKKQATENTQPTDQSQSPANDTDLTTATDTQTDQQQLINNLKDFAKKQKMIEDDLKGLVVDQQA